MQPAADDATPPPASDGIVRLARGIALGGGLLTLGIAILVTISIIGRRIWDQPVPGDFDGDYDVDAADLAEFVERMNGPFADPTLAGWHLLDLDPDYDVDLHDFTLLQNQIP